jgi:hypothetical protein
VQRSESVNKSEWYTVLPCYGELIATRIYNETTKRTIVDIAHAMFVKSYQCFQGMYVRPFEPPTFDPPRPSPEQLGHRKAQSTKSTFAPRAGARRCKFLPGSALHPGLHPARTPASWRHTKPTNFSALSASVPESAVCRRMQLIKMLK